MEWLLSHPEEEMEATIAAAGEPATGTETAQPSEGAAAAGSGEPPEASGTSETAEAKSLKCDDCGRLFKSQLEVEFHAAKSGHSNFSESTEEKKPLTEEEKKEQLAKIEEKMRQKRLEREEKEKLEALDREKTRIRSGKEMLEAKARMEEQEMKKLVEQRKREKLEEKMARERVRAQIESDKAARRAKAEGQSASAVVSTPPQTNVQPSPVGTTSNTPKNYKTTRIQVRLLNGSTLTETFEAKEQLAAIRLFIQLKTGETATPFGLMTNFPKKVFSDQDYEKPLEELGLVPSAVLIVTRGHMA